MASEGLERGGRKVKISRLIPVLTVLGLVLTACSGVPGASSEAPEDAGPVSKDVANAGDVTLEVWDFHNTGGENKWAERLNREFTDKYPNVTIDRHSQSFTDLMATLNLKVSSEDPPDVVAANQGWQSMGTLSEAGLLLPLDKYAEAYGWQDLYPESLLKQHMFTRDGNEMGKGTLFGMPNAFTSIVGAFYNRTKLQDLGLKLPETFEEFERALQIAKDEGEIPIQLGALEQWPITTPFFATLNTMASQDYINNLVYGQGDVSFDSSETIRAASTLQEWAQNGYFAPGYNGVSVTDADQRFAEGEGLFIISGTGSSATYADGLGSDLGFSLLPAQGGQAPIATGSSQSDFSIPSGSDTPDVAAAYIDFFASQHAAEVAAEISLLPLLKVEGAQASSDSVYTDMLEAQQLLFENDAYVPYLDWATPTFLDTLGKAAQSLASGRLTPDQFVSTGQSDYAKFRAKKE